MLRVVQFQWPIQQCSPPPARPTSMVMRRSSADRLSAGTGRHPPPPVTPIYSHSSLAPHVTAPDYVQNKRRGPDIAGAGLHATAAPKRSARVLVRDGATAADGSAAWQGQFGFFWEASWPRQRLSSLPEGKVAPPPDLVDSGMRVRDVQARDLLDRTDAAPGGLTRGAQQRGFPGAPPATLFSTRPRARESGTIRVCSTALQPVAV